MLPFLFFYYKDASKEHTFDRNLYQKMKKVLKVISMHELDIKLIKWQILFIQ